MFYRQEWLNNTRQWAEHSSGAKSSKFSLLFNRKIRVCSEYLKAPRAVVLTNNFAAKCSTDRHFRMFYRDKMKVEVGAASSILHPSTSKYQSTHRRDFQRQWSIRQVMCGVKYAVWRHWTQIASYEVLLSATLHDKEGTFPPQSHLLVPPFASKDSVFLYGHVSISVRNNGMRNQLRVALRTRKYSCLVASINSLPTYCRFRASVSHSRYPWQQYLGRLTANHFNLQWHEPSPSWSAFKGLREYDASIFRWFFIRIEQLRGKSVWRVVELLHTVWRPSSNAAQQLDRGTSPPVSYICYASNVNDPSKWDEPDSHSIDLAAFSKHEDSTIQRDTRDHKVHWYI